MLEAESRKRAHADEPESLPAKKRALSDTNGAPVLVNGVVAATPPPAPVDEPKDQDSLEQFRKEAIFRRMRHYARENERSLTRVAELERLKDTYESSLLAVGACWEQLVETIRGLIKHEATVAVEVKTEDLFRLPMASDSYSTLAEALEEKSKATRSLLTAFVQLGAAASARDDFFQQYQKSQSECTSLRAELALTRAKLEDSEGQLEKYRAGLAAAEIRYDRMQSRSVQLSMGQATPPTGDVKLEAPGTVEEAHVKAESVEPGESPPTVAKAGSLEEQLKAAQVTIDRQEQEITLLRADHDHAVPVQEIFEHMYEGEPPPAKYVQEHEIYKSQAEHVKSLEHALAEKSAQYQAVSAEVSRLHSERKKIEERANKDGDKMVDDLRLALAKRDGENLRLREAREKLSAELFERKQTESTRRQSLDQYRQLAESRSERMSVLQSEVNRLKRLVAANAGDEDLVIFLASEKADGATYVDDLKARLETAEERVSALEKQLSYFEVDNPDIVRHMRSEAEARQQLAEATKVLSRYKSTYGEPSTLPPDTQRLSEQLRKKEDEIRALRLQESQRAEAESALYLELEKLSSAWEKVDQQLGDKIFDLTAFEDKIEKLTLEKAKSETRYYACMRDKDAIENESKLVARDLATHKRVTEKWEKDFTRLQALLDEQIKIASDCDDVVKNAQKELEESQKEFRDYKVAYPITKEEAQYWAFRVTKINKLHEIFHVGWRQKITEHLAARQQAEKELQEIKAQPVNSVGKEASLQKEIEKCMSILKCSTCHNNMRSTVLLKCLHTFCKPCVDARVATRQRKCPACNLAFAQSDVQQIFFQ
ncbi:hypothetical protein FA95DRAFT_1678426 [Auriscalpium vulgare]|uniref:Uncharacterized protein n=1 Tax=Auriscalpium vulgare TaxID=40419 RepID=A0ACB8RXB6_9AGAM|nr:hypothetical protein FA95DRAFT_1678426 [Auriscalpium vulgare]